MTYYNFLHRCFFICSIALWLEEVDADRLPWLEETQLPFLVLSALLFSIVLVYLSMWTKTHFLLVYNMLYSGFLSPALEKQLCL